MLRVLLARAWAGSNILNSCKVFMLLKVTLKHKNCKEPFTAMRRCPTSPPHTSAPYYTHTHVTFSKRFDSNVSFSSDRQRHSCYCEAWWLNHKCKGACRCKIQPKASHKQHLTHSIFYFHTRVSITSIPFSISPPTVDVQQGVKQVIPLLPLISSCPLRFQFTVPNGTFTLVVTSIIMLAGYAECADRHFYSEEMQTEV